MSISFFEVVSRNCSFEALTLLLFAPIGNQIPSTGCRPPHQARSSETTARRRVTLGTEIPPLTGLNDEAPDIEEVGGYGPDDEDVSGTVTEILDAIQVKLSDRLLRPIGVGLLLWVHGFNLVGELALSGDNISADSADCKPDSRD
jgi:hypothetical protein